MQRVPGQGWGSGPFGPRSKGGGRRWLAQPCEAISAAPAHDFLVFTAIAMHATYFHGLSPRSSNWSCTAPTKERYVPIELYVPGIRFRRSRCGCAMVRLGPQDICYYSLVWCGGKKGGEMNPKRTTTIMDIGRPRNHSSPQPIAPAPSTLPRLARQQRGETP